MNHMKRSLSGKSRGSSQIRPSSVIDPRLLSLNERLLHAASPSAAPAAPATAWNPAPKQPGFHEFCPDDIGVYSNISPQPDLDSYEPSEISLTYPAENLNRVDHTALSPSTGDIESLVYNDFDAAFVDFDSTQGGQVVDANAISYLSLWIAKNNNTQPSMKQLKALETLTEVPVCRLSEWLKCHGKALLVNSTRPPKYAQLFSSTEEPYRVRCLESGFRYRSPKTKVGAHKIFECTNGCGQKFQRKGDWSRHEKVNFEEWPCFRCGKVLTRCEHLQKHFRDAHPGETYISKFKKRQILKAEQRPCGFCNHTLANWSAWLAHVASHFEGGLGGGSQDMVQWREYRLSAPSDRQRSTSCVPERELPGTESGPSYSSRARIRTVSAWNEKPEEVNMFCMMNVMRSEPKVRQGPQGWERPRRESRMTRVQEEAEEQFQSSPRQFDSREPDDTWHARYPSLPRVAVLDTGTDSNSKRATPPYPILTRIQPRSDPMAGNARCRTYPGHRSAMSSDELDELVHMAKMISLVSRDPAGPESPRRTERARGLQREPSYKQRYHSPPTRNNSRDGEALPYHDAKTSQARARPAHSSRASDIERRIT